MTTPANIGATIREIRRRRGWTQDELARRARITTRAVQYIEAGQRRANPDTMQMIATALETPLWALYWTPAHEEEGTRA